MRPQPLTFWLGFVSLCLWLGLGADVKTTPAILAQTPIENPHFYSFEKNGIRSFMLGTFHLGIRLEQFPEGVTQALDSSHVFIAEDLEKDKIGPDLSAIQRFEIGLLKPKTIKAFIERGIRLEAFSAKSNILAPCIQYTFWDAQPEWQQLDKQLEKRARTSRKQMLALDNKIQLTEAMHRVAKNCDLNEVVDSLSPKAAKHSFLENMQQYISGDESLMQASPAGSEMMLLVERNEQWLPKILAAHHRGAFVAVGALHLYGKDGLLKRLESEGFNITRHIARHPSDSQQPFVSERYTGL